MSEHSKYLVMAVSEASAGMRSGDGGPFGAVVVREGRVIGRGHNTVLRTSDPTAHAEVNAIRQAAASAGRHHLTGATLYTNFEPCPMCLAAAYWADIREVWYSAGTDVAESAGFSDRHLYAEISRPAPEREMRMHRLDVEEMAPLLREWDDKEDKVLY